MSCSVRDMVFISVSSLEGAFVCSSSHSGGRLTQIDSEYDFLLHIYEMLKLRDCIPESFKYS